MKKGGDNVNNLSTQEVNVNISEDQTIVDLSQILQPYQAEIYLEKVVDGTMREVNLKSFLGLITLQLKNGDRVKVKAIGKDHEQALHEVVSFFS
jgi:phosphocarrier protein HPr